MNLFKIKNLKFKIGSLLHLFKIENLKFKINKLLPTRKSRLIASAAVILILLPIVVNTLLSLRKVQASWWNKTEGGGSWLKRQNIPMVNNSGDSLASGTTVAVTVDTKSLVSQGKLQSDCDDLRVVYQSGSTDTELTRYLSYPGGASCSTSEATKVYFKLNAVLADGSSNADTNYYIYYNNGSASSPSSTVDAFDTANDHALLVCPFDGTTTCINGDGAEDPTTATGAIRYSGSKSALSFDGDDDEVTFSNNTFTSMRENFTYEGWIKIDKFRYTLAMIFGKEYNDWVACYLESEPENYITCQLRSSDWVEHTLYSSSSIALNTWYHIALSVDNNFTARLFINGHLEDSLDYSGHTVGAENKYFEIGNDYLGGDMKFYGTMDEVRISDVARYTNDFTPQTTPFIRDEHTKLLLHFDENGDDPRSSGKVFDDSGNGNHGTINGSAKHVAGLVGADNGTSDAGKASGGNSYSGHEGLFIEEETVNKMTNPSFEHSTYNTNWTASASGTLNLNTYDVYKKFGSHSVRLDNSATGNLPINGSGNATGLYYYPQSKRLAQGFQVTETTTPPSATAYVFYRDGSAGSYFRAEIQSDSSGHPSGTPITNGTSNCIAYSSLARAWAWLTVTFTFNTPPTLNTSTQYHLVLKSFSDSCTTEQSSDNPNGIKWAEDTSDPSYSGGDAQYMNESNVWTTDTGHDYIFSIIKQSGSNYSALTTINAGNTNTHTLSAYVYNSTHEASNDYGGTVDATVANLMFNATPVATTYTDVGGGWWRLTYSGTGVASNTTYGVQVLAGKTVYIDGVQLEQKAYVTTYTDGSLTSDAGGTDTYFWDDDCDGTLDSGEDQTADQNAQCSTRTGTELSYESSNNISKSTGSFSIWVKFPSNSTDLDWGDHTIFLDLSGGGSGYTLIYGAYSDPGSFIFKKYINWTTIYSASVEKTFPANEWVHLVATWDTTNGIKLYVNAGTPGSDSNTTEPSELNSVMRFSMPGTTDPLSTSDARIFNSVITSTEITDLYYSGLVSHSQTYEVDAFSDNKGQNPVGIYHFDEGYGSVAHDSSTYANDLTVTNASWDTTPGSFPTSRARSMKFDGSGDYLSRKPETAFDFGTGGFSISGWFDHPASPSATINTLVSKYGSAGYKIYMDTSSHLCFGIDDDNSWGPDDSACSTVAYNDSTWHHFEAVKDGTTSISLYVDGNRVGYKPTLTASGSLNSSSSLHIGSDSTTTNFWTGNLDEIYFYPYTRTADQVKSDYLGLQTSAVYGAQATDPLSGGLLGYWKMDETTSPSLDSSGNGLSGTWHGAGISSSTGKFGNGNANTGANDTYIEVADNNALDFGNNNFTVAFWVDKRAQSSNWSNTFGINKWNIGGGGVGSNEWSIALTTDSSGGNDNRPSFGIENGTTSYAVDSTSYSQLTLNTWAHIVGVRDGNYLKLYLNGSLLGSTDIGTISVNNVVSRNLRFGCSANTNYCANAIFDEVRIYNRALSPSEVAQLYNWAPGPVGYWKMDEGTDQYVNDSSGNGYVATLGANSSIATDDPTWTTGKFGNALNFKDNIDYVKTATLPSLSQTTVTAWIYPRSYNDYAKIVDGYDSSFRLNLYSDTGKVMFDASRVNDYGTAPKTNTAVPLNQWTFVAGVYDGTNEYLYMNGVKQTENRTTYAGTVLASIGYGIGSGKLGGNEHWIGMLDDIRIYNYARTSSQIIEDMNAGHPTPGSPIGSAVGEWKFEEGFGDTAHNTGNGGSLLNGNLGSGTCPGFFINCPLWRNDGKFGKALQFGSPSESIVDLGDNFDFGAGQDFTVSVWVNTTQSPVADLWPQIINKDHGGLDGYSLGLHDSNTDARWYASAETCMAYGLSNIADGSWHHLVMTRSGSNLITYQDGMLVNTTNCGGSADLSNAYSLFFGSDYWDGNKYEGLIDEVKIYDFALTSDQIKLLYNGGFSASMGVLSTASSSATTTSSARSYCPPGDTGTCNPPVGEWKMDENTGQYVYDTSGNDMNLWLGSNDSPDSHDPVWSTGKYGSGLFFDGVDDVVLSGSTDTWADSITIEGWIKPQSFPGTGNNETFYEGYNGWFELNNSDEINCGFSGLGGSTDHPTTNANLIVNNWYHVACVFDNSGNTVKIYVNGVEKLNESETDSPQNSPRFIHLGYCDACSGQYYNGSLDDFRIYRYARTPAQIAWDYNQGAPVAQYDFDECSGTVLHDTAPKADRSTTGLNGTITEPGSGSNNAGVGSCSVSAATMWNGGATGKYSSSLEFDGTDDSVSLGTGFPNLSNTYTLSTWIKPQSLSGGAAIISRYGSNGDMSFIFRTDQQYRAMLYVTSNGFAGVGFDIHSASDLFADNVWVMLTITFDGSKVHLYKNGQEQGSGDFPYSTSIVPFSSTSTATMIGRMADNTYPFSGQIDDVKIWNYALSSEQVKTEYNGGSAVRFGP